MKIKIYRFETDEAEITSIMLYREPCAAENQVRTSCQMDR